MSNNKSQKENPKDKSKSKGFIPPGGYKPKAFEQFSNPKNYQGGPHMSQAGFHRRLNTRRSSGK